MVVTSKVPEVTERADFNYWTTTRSKRPELTPANIKHWNNRLKLYSLARFVLGRRFKLTVNYCGIPKGTHCSVVSVWPNTEVVWDKLGKARRRTCMSFDLDCRLSFVKDTV